MRLQRSESRRTSHDILKRMAPRTPQPQRSRIETQSQEVHDDRNQSTAQVVGLLLGSSFTGHFSIQAIVVSKIEPLRKYNCRPSPKARRPSNFGVFRLSAQSVGTTTSIAGRVSSGANLQGMGMGTGQANTGDVMMSMLLSCFATKLLCMILVSSEVLQAECANEIT